MVIKKALIDLSGTLHIENTITPNAVAALKKFVLPKCFLNLFFLIYVEF